MKLTYETTIKFQVVHEIDKIENIKDNNEYAQEIAQLVCDESTITGAVATYEIVESKIDIKGEQPEKVNEIIYNDFIKNSHR